MGKGHARNEDIYLNKGGENEVGAVDVKDAVTKKHDGITQLNKNAINDPFIVNGKTITVVDGQIISLGE